MLHLVLFHPLTLDKWMKGKWSWEEGSVLFGVWAGWSMSCRCDSQSLSLPVCYAPLHCKVEVSCNSKIWSWKKTGCKDFICLKKGFVIPEFSLLSYAINHLLCLPSETQILEQSIKKKRDRALIPWLQLSCAIYIYWASGCRETKSSFNILQRLWVYKWLWAARAEKWGRGARRFLCLFTQNWPVAPWWKLGWFFFYCPQCHCDNCAEIIRALLVSGCYHTVLVRNWVRSLKTCGAFRLGKLKCATI